MVVKVEIERMKASPIAVSRTRRTLDLRCLTSVPAGKMTPLACWPLLREDSQAASTITLGWEMQETAELIVNPINVRVQAWLVPHLALERFQGMDDLNRSYMKQPARPGGAVTPFYEMIPFNYGLSGDDIAGGVNSVYKYLGLHGKDTDLVNSNYLESYNQIWNHRAKNRSQDLFESSARGRLDTHLAPAFWYHEQLAMVVPDFQQAIMEGAVPLTATNALLPVKTSTNEVGLGISPAMRFRQTLDGNYPGPFLDMALASGEAVVTTDTPSGAGFSGVFPTNLWADYAATPISVLLSDIEMARKTQAYALLRQQYNQLPDEWIIDLLMNGIAIPDQEMMQPIMLGERTTMFGMSKRYASDAENLTESVVNGLTQLSMTIATPKINCGGTVMIVAEVTPEQLWERQRDMAFFIDDQERLPEYLRDSLDPEKVEVVLNKQVDASHSQPDGVFGYAPLNWRWAQKPPCVGGKFYKRDASTEFDEDRQRIWAVETVDPSLSASFYICNNIHTKPFVDTVSDSFEVTTRGMVSITGLTQFGPILVEGSGDYEAIMEEAPTDRIQKPTGAVLPTATGSVPALEGNK